MYFRHILNATSNHQSALFSKKWRRSESDIVTSRWEKKNRIFKKIKLTPIWWNRKRILIHVMIDESALNCLNRTGRRPNLQFTRQVTDIKRWKILYKILIAENSWENLNPMDRLDGMIQSILLMVDNLL